jgi:hypothetical protein
MMPLTLPGSASNLFSCWCYLPEMLGFQLYFTTLISDCVLSFLNMRCSVYVVDINRSSDILFANTFFFCVCCLFTVLMLSFFFFLVVLGFEFMALWLLGRHCIVLATPSAFFALVMLEIGSLIFLESWVFLSSLYILVINLLSDI